MRSASRWVLHWAPYFSTAASPSGPLSVGRALRLVLAIMLSFVAGLAPKMSQAQTTAGGQKYAVLVGVDKYPRNGLLSSLNFPERDVEELAKVLIASGYAEKNVRVLTRTRGFDELSFLPNAANIRHEIKLLLADKRPEDSVLIVLSGHGVLMNVDRLVDGKMVPREETLFCPIDADLRSKDPRTFISLDLLYDDLAACPARVRFLLCDACRDKAFAGARPGGVNLPPPVTPPRSVAALFSCSKEEVAYEDQNLAGGHGVFLHFAIEGLKGAADANGDGRVTSFELAEYCGQKVGAHVRERFGNRQTPELAGSLQSVTLASVERRPAGPPPLLIAPFTAAEAKGAQEAWAQHLGKKVIEENSLGMKLVLIPPGEFRMGSSDADVDGILRQFSDASEVFTNEQPQRRVRITRPFYLGLHEVTQGQFLKFYHASGEKTDAEKEAAGGAGYNAADKKFERAKRYTFWNTGFTQTPDHPVVNVSHNDAAAFCRWLGRQEGQAYDLPTEAQWEYACRAGTTTLFHHGDDGGGLRTTGNVADQRARAIPGYPENVPVAAHDDGFAFASPVGSFRPNAFGLYDMHGNIWEWCRDWYGEKYYAAAPTDDPAGPETGSLAVLRGGSWSYQSWNGRSAFRYWAAPALPYTDVGFRVVRTP